MVVIDHILVINVFVLNQIDALVSKFVVLLRLIQIATVLERCLVQVLSIREELLLSILFITFVLGRTLRQFVLHV